MTKVCYDCKKEKNISEFGKASRNIDGLNYRCKECYTILRRSWYENNKEYHKAKVRERRVRLLAPLQKWMAEYLLEHPCVDCGNKDILVLEFDHIDGSKEYGVGSVLRSHLSLERVQAEITKCEVRCVNCHRKITNKRRKESKGI